MELSFKKPIKDLVVSRNIATEMGDEDLQAIGLACLSEYKQDKASRSEWEQWYADAMKLALQVLERKSYPWPNCSNVKFPLLTIAAINFHARAYPTLINGSNVVTYKVFGTDDAGIKAQRAKRVSAHQNYMLLEHSDWEEHTDKALIVTPIMGCSFKKSLYDHDKRTIVSRLVLPQNLVVPYYTASLEETPRITELFDLTPNAFTSRKRRKQYLDVKYDRGYTLSPTDPMVEAKKDAQKIDSTNYGDDDLPIPMAEQHRYLDLDGDGYAEPYVVTFIRETGQICRIVARYSSVDVEYAEDNRVAYITPQHFYTKIPFIPSPDGGFYDLGFGMLLGPLNYAADSLINQLIDAGTLHNLGGGWLARGVKIRRGETTFVPGEWKPVDAPGMALKDNVVPLPVRQPSQVLLDLLVFLVQYAERVSSANEIQMGEIPGQNVKAEVMQIAQQNGLKVFAAIYKRMWRAHKEEFKKIYRATSFAIVSDQGANDSISRLFGITSEDYKMPSEGVCPAADPNIASPEEALRKATAVLQHVMAVPGQNVYEASMRYYNALGVERPELIFPDPKSKDAIPQQPDPKAIEAQAKAQLYQAQAQKYQQDITMVVYDLQMRAGEVQARITKLLSDAAKAQAEASGVAAGHAIALIQSQIAAEKHHFDGIIKTIELLRKDNESAGPSGGADAGGSAVSPVAGTS